MIAFLRGTIISKQKDTVTLLTADGVGYEVRLPVLALSELHVGEQGELYIYTKVSDQAIDLYGFRTGEERTFFKLLLSVSGVGPKSAQNILGLGSVTEIADAIARGDAKYLTAVQGMGKKTAERLCVELKHKVSASSLYDDVDAVLDGQVIGDVIDALVSMGYTKEDVKQVIRSIASEEATVEDLLRQALQQLAR